MNQKLRETKNHGTKDYPYSQYCISNLPYGFHFPVHWHEELELIYVLRGHLLVNAGGTDFDLTAGQVLIINPRQLHLMTSNDRQVVYHTLLFPLELISFQTSDQLEQTVFRPLRTNQRMFANLVPEQVLTPENLALLDRVVAINQQKPHLYQLETRLLLLRFFMEVLRFMPLTDREATNTDELQRQLLEYIRIHYKRKLPLTELAEQFHLSPKYVSRYFKEKFHLTISDYISHLRMSHAKELLEHTDLSVTEIAAQSGFSGVSFFIRRFTEANGCPPLKWRKLQKGS